MTNILTSLNAGSGIDVKAMAQSLVDAEKAPRLQLLDDRQARVESRISALGQFRSALDALVGALNTRISSGALSGIAAISDPTVLAMKVDPGTIVPRQQLEVRSLASTQSLASAPVADSTAAIGVGSLTIRFGTVAGQTDAGAFTPGTQADFSIDIDASNNSLEGIKNAINDAAAVSGSPVQAQIVRDADGARLSLRGAFGQESGFIVETSGDAALQAFAFGEGITGGMVRTQAANDAVIAIDGLELRRPSNIITDLIPGTRITLSKAAPGQIVTLMADRDATQLSQAVRDVTAALNELGALGRELSNVNQATGSAGALVSDSATRRALQQMGRMNTEQLIPANGDAPTRLSEIGISIDRYGSFQVDEGRLSKAVANHPAAVEQLLTALNKPASFSSDGGPLPQLAAAIKLASEGSSGQPTALAREAAAIARERTLLNARSERSLQNYTRQFAALDSAVGQYRSLQEFMKQQVAMWTRSTDA